MSTKSKRIMLTSQQAKEWEEERTKENPKNPKTGSRIQRDGPTYAKLEEAFSKLTIKPEVIMLPIPEKANVSKDKMENVLNVIIQASDPRTAAKMGLINKAAQQDYQRLIPAETRKLSVEIFDTETVKEMMYQGIDSYNKYNKRTYKSNTIFRLNEPSMEVILAIKTKLDRMMTYLRKVTRIQPTEKIIKSNGKSYIEETPEKIWANYNKNFRERYQEIAEEVDFIVKNMKRNPLTPIYKIILERIYQKYDITKDIAFIYTQIIWAYMNIIMRSIMFAYHNRNLPYKTPAGIMMVTLDASYILL